MNNFNAWHDTYLTGNAHGKCCSMFLDEISCLLGKCNWPNLFYFLESQNNFFHKLQISILQIISIFPFCWFLEICNLQNGNVLMIFKIEICSLRNGNMLTICKFAIPILQIISIFPFRKYLQIFISFGFVSPIIVGPMKQKYRSQIASRNLCVVDLMLKRKQIR